MKKFLFALPVFALAFAVSFCTKEPAFIETVQQIAPANAAATDRSPCNVNIAATGQVRVCGLAAVGSPCQDCMVGGPSTGESGINFLYLVNSPDSVPFTITNLTNNVVDVTVTTVSSTSSVSIKPGGCRRFSEYNCGIVLSAQ